MRDAPAIFTISRIRLVKIHIRRSNKSYVHVATRPVCVAAGEIATDLLEAAETRNFQTSDSHLLDERIR